MIATRNVWVCFEYNRGISNSALKSNKKNVSDLRRFARFFYGFKISQ